MQFIFIPLALALLFLTRRKLTIELGKLVGRFGGGNNAFAIIWSIIFLPGTIVHEMSHFFAAAFTGARIGNVDIFPKLPRSTLGTDTTQQQIHLGSVQTQRLGLIRGFLVGGAPFLVGLGLLVWISSAIEPNIFIALLDPSTALGITERIVPFLQLYVFFTIANSLFLSWVDLKHALPFVVVVALLATALYLSGIQLAITPDSFMVGLAHRLQTALLWSVGINSIVMIVLFVINSLTKVR